MQFQSGIKRLQLAKQINVKLQAQIRMMPALQQQLLSPIPESFLNLYLVSFNIGDVSVLMSRNPVEIAKLAIGNANIGCIQVSVDNPGNLIIRLALFSELIPHKHQLRCSGRIKKKYPFLST